MTIEPRPARAGERLGERRGEIRGKITPARGLGRLDGFGDDAPAVTLEQMGLEPCECWRLGI